MNQTLLEKVRCMLSNASLGKQFWAEVVMYASHLINRLPSASLNGKTPLEVWSGKPINDYDTLHVFGSTAYYHVKESKLDPRAKKALFMGVTLGVKGYRLWCLYSKKIISSRDVTFDESCHARRIPVRPDWQIRTEVQGVILSILSIYYTVLGLSLTCSFSELYLYLWVYKQFF